MMTRFIISDDYLSVLGLSWMILFQASLGVYHKAASDGGWGQNGFDGSCAHLTPDSGQQKGWAQLRCRGVWGSPHRVSRLSPLYVKGAGVSYRLSDRLKPTTVYTVYCLVQATGPLQVHVPQGMASVSSCCICLRKEAGIQWGSMGYGVGVWTCMGVVHLALWSHVEVRGWHWSVFSVTSVSYSFETVCLDLQRSKTTWPISPIKANHYISVTMPR